MPHIMTDRGDTSPLETVPFGRTGLSTQRGTSGDRLHRMPNDALPLDGIRIIDLSRVLAGPLCTMVLGDLGAEVIKVENPEGGDDTRAWGPPFAGEDSAYFLSVNRNKRSISIDLKSASGVETVRRLAVNGDVVIENFRPGLLDSLGLALESLRGANPGLVTCSLAAFDESVSAKAAPARPGYDIIVQALSGLMSVTGEQGGEPVKAGVAVLDVIAGLYAATGISAALRDRERTGRGRHVDVALFDASVAAMVNQAANYLVGGIVAEPMGTAHPNIVPYQAFHASDRQFIVAAGNDRLFRRACEAIGRPEWADDERFRTNERRVGHRVELVQMLESVFATDTADAWLSALGRVAVPCAPIRRIDEVFASPEGAALADTVADEHHGGLLRTVADPIRIDGARLPVRRPPPALGEHTTQILGEILGETD